MKGLCTVGWLLPYGNLPCPAHAPSPQFSDELFEMYREQAERQYKNFSMEQPYQHSMHNLASMLLVVR